MANRFRTTPLDCRFGAVFVVLYRHAAPDSTLRLIQPNILRGRRIGYALNIGPWTLSVGRHT